MTSFRSSAVNFLLRKRHLFRGKFTKEVYDDNTSIAAFRELCEKGAERYAKIPKGVSVVAASVAGLKSEWLIPDGADESKMILYVHGGGYVSGSCSDHRAFVSKFAANAGYRTLIFEYRLAPEHPFPAAVEDSVAVYRDVLSTGIDPRRILLAGESAGGGLALALLLAIKAEGLPMPVAAAVISPWTDLTCSSESYQTKNRRSLAPLNSWHVFARHYTGGHPATDPLVSPLFGDPAGLPPLLVNSGADDELFEDGEKFSAKAREAGVEVTFRAGPGMVHCYPLLAPMFPEATEAMNEIVGFVKHHLG